jgi:hypothetical protein
MKPRVEVAKVLRRTVEPLLMIIMVYIHTYLLHYYYYYYYYYGIDEGRPLNNTRI